MKYKFLLIPAIVVCNAAFAQITVAEMQHFFATYKQQSHSQALQLSDVNTFYEATGFKTAWVKNEGRPNCLTLLNALKQSADRGLETSDYPVQFVESVYNNHHLLQTEKDFVETDIKITAIAIQYYTDLAYGNTQPVIGYNGLAYQPQCYNIPMLLAGHLLQNSLSLLQVRLSSGLPEIDILANKIRFINKIIADSSFKEVPIQSNKAIISNQPLILKLYQLGLIDSVNGPLNDQQLKKAIQEAQRQFGLLADGALRSTIMTELNRPLSVRLQQLNLSINYYRWLHCLVQDQQVIVVNIPAAYLKVYHSNKIILEMRMVLGTHSTPTPTLLSKVREVVLYPYWHVPYSIATKELLPRIRKNPAFLDAGNYQVLNRSGKIIDPDTIDWNSVTAKNFPYIIRQSTGCDNALGLLKLNFESPFGVYLHDTPFKEAFLLNKRYFSHGCLRMENPMQLGHLILKNHPATIDTLEEKGCLRNQSPIVVPADEKMPVVVWYNPAGIDSTGRVLYYEDIYRKFRWLK